MRLLPCLLAAAALGRAAAPAPADQEAMQASVRRLITALNDRDFDAARRATTPDFDAYIPGRAWFDHKRLSAAAHDFPKLELSALMRILRQLTPDAAIGDGFFRTAGAPGGDAAGRIVVNWVRRDGQWLVAAARFMPFRNEPPILTVEPAAQHDPPGPDGWTALGPSDFVSIAAGAFPASWKIEGGELHAVTRAGNFGLRTRDTYRSFELQFEWKVPPKGNSGLKYRLYYLSAWPSGADGAGNEYQIADDSGDPGAIAHPHERAGALYNQVAPQGAAPKPPGEYNQGAIIVRGRHAEHWLNGVKVVEYEAESGALEGPILLQHHGTEAWYRNLRIRRLDP